MMLGKMMEEKIKDSEDGLTGGNREN